MSYNYASWRRRFAAHVIDDFIATLVCATLAGALCGGGVISLLFAFGGPVLGSFASTFLMLAVLKGGESFFPFWICFVVAMIALIIVICMYIIIPLTTGGQTIAKMMLGIRMLRADCAKITIVELLKRQVMWTILYMLSIITLIGPFVLLVWGFIISPRRGLQKQALHDKIGGIIVIKT